MVRHSCPVQVVDGICIAQGQVGVVRFDCCRSGHTVFGLRVRYRLRARFKLVGFESQLAVSFVFWLVVNSSGGLVCGFLVLVDASGRFSGFSV